MTEDVIKLKRLRKLYPKGNSETSNRTVFRLTIRPETREIVENIVPFGKGLYGSPYIELAIRLFSVLLTGNEEDINIIFDEIYEVTNSNKLKGNIRHLSNLINKT